MIAVLFHDTGLLASQFLAPIPLIVPAVIATVAIVKTIFDVFSNIKSGNAAKELAEFNAKVSEQQADEAIVIGRDEEQRYRLGVEGVIGRARAGFAAQNVDVGVGTPVDIVADAAYLGELDALTIRTNAFRLAWGFRIEAENLRRGGQNAQTASRFAAAGSILSGTSLLASQFGFQDTGRSSPLRSTPISGTGGVSAGGTPTITLG